jgi:hypothetical protein
MLGSMKETRDQEDERSPLNKSDNQQPLSMNRGLELLLRKNRKREEVPKTFQVKFGKLFSLFNREIDFYLELHLDFKKRISRRK